MDLIRTYICARERKEEKQVSILLTLFQGKLVDYYVDLDATTKADLKLLKMTRRRKLDWFKTH